jgi:2-haloacid dehalogenase
MPGRWVTFDCYGTLVDWWTGMEEAARAVAGDRAAVLLDAYHAHELILEAERPAHSYRHVLQEGLRRAAGELGVGLAGAGDMAFVETWTTMPVFDDVGSALGELRDAGWNLAVLTNCDDDLIAQTQTHIPAQFDMVVTAEQVGSYKPDLDHFRAFRERAGVGEGEWVHAACSWMHDILPAARMGIPRVWVDRDRSGHPPGVASAVLHDMTGLPQAVAQVSAR